MTQSVSPTVLRRRLGGLLKDYRERERISLTTAAGRIGMDRTTLGRVETGRVGIRQQDLQALCRLYKLSTPDLADLLEMRNGANQRGWWSQHRKMISQPYLHYIGFEAGAREVLDWGGIIIPGLLQTREYAEALLSTCLPKLSPEEIEIRTTFRMRRQDRLTERQPLVLRAIVDESVLYRRIGGDEVWEDQMDHLHTMSQRLNIELRILPFEVTAHPGCLGSFVVLKFDDDPSITYLEHAAGDLFLDEPEAGDYAEIFNALVGHSVGGAQARDLISRALEEREDEREYVKRLA